MFTFSVCTGCYRQARYSSVDLHCINSAGFHPARIHRCSPIGRDTFARCHILVRRGEYIEKCYFMNYVHLNVAIVMVTLNVA